MDFPNSWATPKVSHTDADWWVATFYGFSRINDPAAVKASMLAAIGQDRVYGTILIAEEGANGTLCAPTRDLLARTCLLYTSPSPRDRQKSRMPSSA